LEYSSATQAPPTASPQKQQIEPAVSACPGPTHPAHISNLQNLLACITASVRLPGAGSLHAV